MAYPAYTDLKTELGLRDSFTDHDAKLAVIMQSSIELAERYCGRSFDAVNATRNFAARDILTREGNLHLPTEFLQLEQLYVNGQTWNYIDRPDDYVLLSADGKAPYVGVALSFSLPRPLNGMIGVRAQFGYCLVANIPFLVHRAMILIGAADYRQSLTALRGVDLDRQRAAAAAPEGIPDTPRVMLNQYRVYR